MFSAETLKAQIYEYLLKDGPVVKDKTYAHFYALGNDSPLLFDVTPQYPESPADFTENRGRCVISGPTGGSVSDLGNLAVWPLTIACFALSSPDAGYLAEHVLRKIRGWKRESFLAINHQCLQSFHSFRLSGPQRLTSNDLFFSTIQFVATVSLINYQEQPSQNRR